MKVRVHSRNCVVVLSIRFHEAEPRSLNSIRIGPSTKRSDEVYPFVQGHVRARQSHGNVESLVPHTCTVCIISPSDALAEYFLKLVCHILRKHGPAHWLQLHLNCHKFFPDYLSSLSHTETLIRISPLGK